MVEALHASILEIDLINMLTNILENITFSILSSGSYALTSWIMKQNSKV